MLMAQHHDVRFDTRLDSTNQNDKMQHFVWSDFKEKWSKMAEKLQNLLLSSTCFRAFWASALT
jgi:hypothetical protein